MSWLVAPRWTYSATSVPTAAAQLLDEADHRHAALLRRRRAVRRRRSARPGTPRRSPPQRRGISPAAAWAAASAASTSSIACSHAVGEVSAATAPRPTKRAKGSASRSPRRRTHRHLGGGCRSGSARVLRRGDEEVAAFGRDGHQRGVGVVGRILVREVDARDDAVEQATGEHRDRQVRRLRRAVDRGDRRWLAGVDLVAAVGVGGAAGEQPVGLPRLDEGVGDRRAGTVGDGAVDVDGVGEVGRDGEALRRIGEGDVEERPDRLRRRLQRAAQSPSPPRTACGRAAQDDVEAEPERPLRRSSCRGRSGRRARGRDRSGTEL